MRNLNATKLKQNIESRIENDLKEQNICGASVIVRQHGKVLYRNCFGKAGVSSDKDVTKDTVFRLASMTKPITAVATLILIERGLLKLEDKVEDYLSEFKNLKITAYDESGKLTEIGEVKTPPTILHILTHTSGIGPSGGPHASKMPMEDYETLEKTVEYFAKAGVQFEPFSREWYSGFAAFDVLTLIIEKVTGKDYNTFLKEEIFEPLGMNNTTFLPSENQWNNLIEMFDKKDGIPIVGETYENCVFDMFPCTHFVGGAGLVSVIDDYSVFAEMLLNGGEYNGKRIISENSVKLMSTPHVPESIQQGTQRWGLGVRVITKEEYKYLPVGAFGWSGAYGTHFWVDPVNKITAVYMKNSLYDGGSGAITALNFEKDVESSLC